MNFVNKGQVLISVENDLTLNWLPCVFALLSGRETRHAYTTTQ